ncbi:unnamed protein product [Nippostrongylus brasiliensis]|uniref:Putative choline/ethanolamine kinase (inferred by orthology to a S. mansoni protein) n=1 Tax=Nippostrongylus brasiliensis TaxID=27835 RepID=A0A0N4YWW3_NIPBR|nr:unnamed protein product [Nippostrongylus brasiliensis]
MATQVNDSHDSDVSLLTIFSKFNSDTTDSVILDKARELCAEYLGGVWGQIDSTQLKLKRMSFIRNIAKLTAEINDVDMPLPKSPQFVTLFPAVVTIDDLEKELDEIDAFMKAQKGPSVFCHNDIVPSNVLVKTGIDGEGESFDYDRLVIIDFEFAIYNLR